MNLVLVVGPLCNVGIIEDLPHLTLERHLLTCVLFVNCKEFSFLLTLVICEFTLVSFKLVCLFLNDFYLRIENEALAYNLKG